MNSNDRGAGQARAELMQRAEKHLALTANCHGFQDDLTHARRCKMCAGSASDHLIRDLLAVLAETPPPPPGRLSASHC